MEKFSDIMDTEQLEDFLKDLYNRYSVPECGDKSIILSHYTSITSALGILRDGYIWLGDYKKMNDKFERAILDRMGMSESLYYTSFSKADESLAMYKMYGGEKPEAMVVIQIPIEKLYSDMSFSCHGEYAGGIDDDGKYPQYNRKGHIVKSCKVLDRTIYASFYLGEVAYFEPITGRLYLGDQENDHIISPFKSPNLAGLVKYKCWDYESEIRLCALTSEVLEADERIALKLPDDFYKGVKVVLAPGFDDRKYEKELMELRSVGVAFSPSIYQGVY